MQAVLAIEDLPPAALDAAAEFHRRHLGAARELLRGEVDSLVIVFPAAPYDHSDWRRAAIADLAREAAPKRVNGVTGSDARARAETLAWLEGAPGVTGQLLPVVANSPVSGTPVARNAGNSAN